ncbi:MAG: hypothetical protein R6T92_02230, partial [Desulfosalsimonadaceae bacterium]
SRRLSRRTRCHMRAAYHTVKAARQKKKANIMLGASPPSSAPNMRGCWVRHMRMAMKLMGTEIKATTPLIMHPGPINRGVEIAPEAADGPHSIILDQVTNGVALRMAVFYLLAGGIRNADSD